MKRRLSSSGCTCRKARSPWRSATRWPLAPRYCSTATGLPSRVTSKRELRTRRRRGSRPRSGARAGRRRPRSRRARAARASARCRRRRGRRPACAPCRPPRSRRRRGRSRRRAASPGPTRSRRRAWVGCRCWKPVMSRRTTMKCMRLVCSTSKSRTVLPRRSTTRKASSNGLPGVAVLLREPERQAVVADREPADGLRGHLRAGAHLAHRGLAGLAWRSACRGGRRWRCPRTRRRRRSARGRPRTRRAWPRCSCRHRVVAGLVDGRDDGATIDAGAGDARRACCRGRPRRWRRRRPA